MAVTAKLNYLRIAPRKARLVADLIRGKRVEQAQTILNFTTKRAAPVLLKLLKQAVANARNQFQLEESNLYISKITVDEGPKYKRWRAQSRGRAAEIQKKSSHITLVLDVISDKKLKKIKKAKKVEKVEMVPKVKKTQKFRPEIEMVKPKIEKGIKKIFRRKAF